MGFGLQTFNGSDELTISSDGVTYSYVGRATLVSVTQKEIASPTLRRSGFSTYTINWAGDIIAVLPVKSNGTTALRSMSQAGSTWTIVVHKGDGTFDADAFDIQEATEVYVFGAPVSVSGFGAALYSDAGALVADLSRQPLTYKARLAMAANVLSATLPGGATVPAIIGVPTDYKTTGVPSGIQFINRTFLRGWQLNGSNIERNQWLYQWTRDDGGISGVDNIRAIDAVIVEANGLA